MGGSGGKSEGGAPVQFEGDGKLRGSATEAYAYLTCIAYSMLTDAVPSRKEIQLQLERQEGGARNPVGGQGLVSWVSDGIGLQEQQ